MKGVVIAILILLVCNTILLSIDIFSKSKNKNNEKWTDDYDSSCNNALTILECERKYDNKSITAREYDHCVDKAIECETNYFQL